MKKLKLICLTIVLLGLIANSSVWAHGRYNAHRLNFGLNLGYNPFYYGSFGYRDPFFYPPYYAYPPTVVMPSAPPYISNNKKQPRQPSHRFNTGTIAEIPKAIIHMSNNARAAGSKWCLNHLHNNVKRCKSVT
jgi:hypothetical protein